MTQRLSHAIWNGTLKDGNGTMLIGNAGFAVDYTFLSRFENGAGTNPEELIGAAHAGCFSMALSHQIEAAGFKPGVSKNEFFDSFFLPVIWTCQ